MMPTVESPGSLLRRIRKSRVMTLKVAAKPMGLSAAALSRLERNERAPDGDDIRAAIATYDLSPWESFQLYRAADILPQPVPELPEPIFLTYSIEFLRRIGLPAIMLDRFGYYVAWNGILQSMWGLPVDRVAHSMDDLFSEMVRTKYGAEWRAYAVRSLWAFYLRSIMSVHDDGFRVVIDELADRHGPEFVELWNEAQVAGYQTGAHTHDELILVERHATLVGPIEFVATAALMRSPTHMEIFVFVPFGAESVERYRQLVETVGMETVHLSPVIQDKLEFAVSIV